MKHCCIPGCDVHSLTGKATLFHIPAKKYCSGAKLLWANELEKLIRSLRKDKWLDELYKRDSVSICKNHFHLTDITQKGSRMELRVGAIPQLNLPNKSVSFGPHSSRQPPTIRENKQKVYHKNLADLEKSALHHLPKTWNFQRNGDEHISFYSSSTFGVFPKLMVKINNSLQLHVGFCGWFTVSGHGISSIDVSKMTISSIIQTVSTFQICEGISHGHGDAIKTTDDAEVAMHYIMVYDGLETMDVTPKPPSLKLIAIRSKSCVVFLDSGKVCRSCAAAEKKLRHSQVTRQAYRKEVAAKPVSRSTSCCLNDRLVATVKSKDFKLKEAERTVRSYMSDLESHIDIDDNLSSDLDNLFSSGKDRDEISPFFQLFWNEQLRLNKSSEHGRRYHPELIRFCLRLAMKSSCAYEELRDSGILVLPSKRTLFEYRSVHNSSPGFMDSIKNELKEKAKVMKEHERIIVLSMDEVKVKENIVYSVSMDRMVGFTDLGESRKTCSREPATHALQIYIRGLVSSFSKPVAYYATKSVTSFQLTSIFWECIEELEECGFRVIAFIADGLSANRKMFHELNNLNLKYPYKCRNIYSPQHYIYLIFDPPHLLKTVRNNLYASRSKGPRLLLKAGKCIKWEHFTAVPKLFKTSELRCSKLSDAHFRMQSFAKMRVIYAAQLLSNSVARLMRSRGGPEMESSAWFASTFNKWFDIMNSSCKHTYNKDLKPYYCAEDDRLAWLENDFLPELESWKNSCTGATTAEKSSKFLSWQTHEGLVTTSMAIIELIRSLLPTLPSGSFIITRRLNQDPLEAFFGQIRRSGGTCENPDISHYGYFQRIIGVNKDLKWRRGSNVECDISDPMPKRSKNC